MAAQPTESQSVERMVNGDHLVNGGTPAPATTTSQAADAEHDTLQIGIYEVDPWRRSWHTLPFPLGSIGSGRLRVEHIQSTLARMLDLSASDVQRLELLFGETKMQDENAPLRDYGVENRSEIVVWTPEAIERRTSGGN
ncbi:hypothetical protein B0T10DRAFT_493730 [Thelonectria olida]|uniref:Ubiquitin-like domain-containing protein n=1 Tax=Thelonectria olida TaxID=1576542 RepID=A0A9P8VYR9_9HYPO|nr:hypothetical protein B0T10DRAFT_493730 [Thelonectria olida]